MRNELIELAKLRQSLKLTRKAIASKLGSSEQSIILWEKGKITPSPAYQTKIRELIKQLRNIEFESNSGGQIKNIIIDLIAENWFEKEITQEDGSRAFLMWRILRLTELERHLGSTVYDPVKIIRALEILCREGKIKIFGVQADGLNDFKFYIEIGQGDFSNWSLPFQPQVKRLYKDSVLTESELKKPEVTFDISGICDKQEAERRAYFQSQYGRHQTLDGKISRENYQDEVSKLKREDKLIDAVEKLGSKDNG